MAQSVTFRQVFRNRRYLTLWLALLVSNFGDWLALLALLSLVAFRWHGTPKEVSGLLISAILPWAVMGSLAGVFVDRWNVKRTMIASDLIRAGIAALLPLAAGFSQLYGLYFLLSLATCFFQPAQNVALRLIVPQEELLVANAINAQTMQLNKILSPAVAGLLVAAAGERACFYLDSFSFVFSAAMVGLMAIRREAAPSGAGWGSVLAQLGEGLRFIAGHRAVAFTMGTVVCAMFSLGAADALFVVYVRDVLKGQSPLFGAVVSLVGAGTIVGALLVGRWGQRAPKVHLVTAGLGGLGLGILLLAWTSRSLLALAGCVGLGLAVAVVLVPAQTLIQQETPPAMLGRTSSTFSSLTTLAQLTSIAAAGAIASWIGIRGLYALVALMLLAVAVLGQAYLRLSRPVEVKPSSA